MSLPTKLLSAPEVATLLGVELDTLYRYARKGQLRGVKIGKLWRFYEIDVEHFVHARLYVSGSSQNGTWASTLPDVLHDASRAGAPGALICGPVQSSYAEVDVLSDRLARALIAKGVGPGDRVLTVLPNSVEFVIACFAAWKARAVVVPEYSAIRAANLAHILGDCAPAALIVDHNLAEQLESMPEALSSVEAIFIKDRTFSLSGLDRIEVESLDAILEREAHAHVALPDGATPDEAASITYTSGSTGMPKGVINTHESWLAGAMFTRDYPRLTASDRMVISLPLHHGFAFRQMLAYILANGTFVIASDIYQALKLLREQRPTALLLVPAACNIAIDHFAPVLKEADSFLRYVEIGSAAIAPERLQQLRDLLPTTDVHLPYGLTEARVGFLTQGPDGLLNRITTISPGLELSVVDADGRPVTPGEIGEIKLRGRGLMKGYWGRPRSEYQALRNDGFRTGDMARVDTNGDVVLLGRIDAMLKVGGRKVNPSEVEMALNRHSGVVESAVAGVPDPNGILENELHAFVVLHRGATLTETELLAHCRQLIEPYKVPARIHFRTSLPKSPVGKILRHALPNST